jgi:hypothetical protein
MTYEKNRMLEFTPIKAIHFASTITNSNTRRLLKSEQESNLQKGESENELQIIHGKERNVWPGNNFSFNDRDAYNSLNRLMRSESELLHAKTDSIVSAFIFINNHIMSI